MVVGECPARNTRRLRDTRPGGNGRHDAGRRGTRAGRHALLFLARVNAMTDSVRTYYRALHPALRMAVSTFVIVDDGLVVTDSDRSTTDYDRMGLPVVESSFHFRQADGWVHAMDLRTTGRGRVRNEVTAAYFRMLGFRAVRHVGTADHLHLSLPVPP